MSKGNVEHNSSTDQLDPRGDAAVEQMTAHLEQTHLSSASEGNGIILGRGGLRVAGR